jgi:hypothetical protein
VYRGCRYSCNLWNHLVDEDGALFTPVSGQITLTVSVQIQPGRRGNGHALDPSRPQCGQYDPSTRCRAEVRHSPIAVEPWRPPFNGILTELFGGLAILLGAFIPLVSVPTILLLAVAIVTVHLPYGFSPKV